MRSIWSYHHWLEEAREQASITSKKGYGGNYKSGKENYFRKLEERYLLSQLFKLSQHLLWDASNYLCVYVMRLKPW